jgi:hypothetical protein
MYEEGTGERFIDPYPGDQLAGEYPYGAYGAAYGGGGYGAAGLGGGCGCRSHLQRAGYGGYSVTYLPRRYQAGYAYAAPHHGRELYGSVHGMKRQVFQASASIVRHHALKHEAGLRN